MFWIYARVFILIFDGILCPCWFCIRAANYVKYMFSNETCYIFVSPINLFANDVNALETPHFHFYVVWKLNVVLTHT